MQMTKLNSEIDSSTTDKMMKMIRMKSIKTDNLTDKLMDNCNQ